MLRWGSLGLKGAELPDLSPFRVVVDALRGIPAQLIDSGPFVAWPVLSAMLSAWVEQFL